MTRTCPGAALAGSSVVSTGPDPVVGTAGVVVEGGAVVVGDAVPPPTPETATGLSPDWAVGGAVGEVRVATPGWCPDEDSDPLPPPLTAHVASRAATTAIRLNDTISVELRGRWSRRVSAGPSWRWVGGGAGVDAAGVYTAGVDTAGVDAAGAGRDGAGRDGADRLQQFRDR